MSSETRICSPVIWSTFSVSSSTESLKAESSSPFWPDETSKRHLQTTLKPCLTDEDRMERSEGKVRGEEGGVN